MAMFTVYLREPGSPESKRAGASDAANEPVSSAPNPGSAERFLATDTGPPDFDAR